MIPQIISPPQRRGYLLIGFKTPDINFFYFKKYFKLQYARTCITINQFVFNRQKILAVIFYIYIQ